MRNVLLSEQVFMTFTGDHDETGARCFDSDQRNIFRRGSTDAFLLSVPRCAYIRDHVLTQSYFIIFVIAVDASC